MDAEIRFMKTVRKDENGCWLWFGYRNRGGYGRFAIGREKILAHRWSFQKWKSEIPDGLCVLHKCDVPLCVNPDHLFLGTIADNNRDMANKNRHGRPWAYVTHCRHGHEFTDENTIIKKDKKTKSGYARTCRRCMHIYNTGMRKQKRVFIGHSDPAKLE